MFKLNQLHLTNIKFNFQRTFSSTFTSATNFYIENSSCLRRWPIKWVPIKRVTYFRQLKLAQLAFLFGPKSVLVQAYQRSLLRSIFLRLLSVYFVVDSSKSGKIYINDNFLAKSTLSKLNLVYELQDLRFFRSKRLYWVKSSWFRQTKQIFSLSSIRDRVVQVFLKLLLEPIAEVYADSNNYGFRSYRSSHHVLAEIHSVLLNKKYNPAKLVTWSFIIKGFFSQAAKDWLILNLPLPSCCIRIILLWIKDGIFNIALAGGIFLPILLNFMIDGFEKKLASVSYFNNPKFSCLSLWCFRYGSKIIIISTSKRLIENWVLKKTVGFLVSRGLCLKNGNSAPINVMPLIEKNLIFLGYMWSCRNFNFKKDKKDSLVTGGEKVELTIHQTQLVLLRKKLRSLFHYHVHKPAGVIISQVNSFIIRCCKYFCFSQFHSIRVEFEQYLFKLCWNWVIRKHPRWGKRALARYYFLQKNYKFLGRSWIFRAFLQYPKSVKSEEHIKFLYLPTLVIRPSSLKLFRIPLKLLHVHAFHKDFKDYLLTMFSTFECLDY